MHKKEKLFFMALTLVLLLFGTGVGMIFGCGNIVGLYFLGSAMVLTGIYGILGR